MGEGNRGVRIVSMRPGTGYGDAGAQYALGLARLGTAVRWSPVEWKSTDPLAAESVLDSVSPNDRTELERLHEQPVDYDVFLLDVPPPSMHATWRSIEANKRAFAYVTWETDQLPADWQSALDPYERIFVPSKFNRRLLEAEGFAGRVSVVPHVAREQQAAIGTPRPVWGNIALDAFVFYTIGTWYTRKAMEATIRAYLDAFDADDPVGLVVKTTWLDSIAWTAVPAEERKALDRRHVSTAWTLARIVAGYPRPAPIHLITDPLSGAEIDALHGHADCFVSLSRSEGFGLCSFDALLAGNPAVVTPWGGPIDYLGDDYSLSVRYELEPTDVAPNDDQHLRARDAHWARADLGHARELLRRVFEDQAAARELGATMRTRLRQKYAPAAICTRLAEELGLAL